MPTISRQWHLVLSMLENEFSRVSVPFYLELSYFDESTKSIEKELVDRARNLLEKLSPELVASRQTSGILAAH
jgi:hypothetical protein